LGDGTVAGGDGGNIATTTGPSPMVVGDTVGASVISNGRDIGDASVGATVGAIVMVTLVKLHVLGQLIIIKHSHGNGNDIS
jgi:hypothetical protein